MGFFRPTSAEIHLSALKHNYRQVVSLLPPATKIMAMVKADAYGHGAVQVVRALTELGVASLGVATVEEGLELREAGISGPILVLGGLMGVGSAAAGMMVGANLIPVVHSAEVLDFLEATAKATSRPIGIHLKIDTGMTRLGLLPQGLPNILNKLKGCSFLRLDGVMTHLSDADNRSYTDYQMGIFKVCAKEIKDAIGGVSIWHVANSEAVLNNVNVSCLAGQHWVRPGCLLYGSYPDGIKRSLNLKPVMMLKSRVAMIKSVPSGTKISYGCTYETKRASKVGVIPIGYADGYPWALSNKAEVLVRGKRVPVVGRVTMDMTMIDLTDLAEVHIGDEVVLMGSQECDTISIEEVAKWAGTVCYEIWCGVSKRMPRIYIG